MAVLALDIGTSSIKAAVLDLDTLTIRHVRRVPFPDPLTGLPALRREFDPGLVLTTIRGLLEPLVVLCNPCDALLMCNQMHGVIWTTAAGEARSTMTTWQDQRVLEPHPAGGTLYDALVARLTDDQRQDMGNELRPGLPICLLYWYRVQDCLPTDELFPASIGDYVVSALCGTPPTTGLTNAHAHCLLNLDSGAWHAGVLAALGLEGVRLPQLLSSNTVVGYWTINGQRIACYPPIGDFQAALLGALIDDGELSVNISTGSQVSMLRATPERGRFQTRPYADDRSVITVTTIPAGRSLSALVGLLTELAHAQGITLADPWDTIIDRASAVDDPELRVNLSFFESAVGSRGAITDIREDELTIGHLFRAAFQNMAHNYLSCALRLSPQQHWQRLVFSGGVAHRVDLLRTLIGDRFGVPYRVSPSQEDTLLGLLVLGLTITGRAGDVRDATAIVKSRFTTA